MHRREKDVNPAVSIIIPTYNTEAYIVKAVESALGQTEQAVEVIVVDDASTDATVEAVERFSDQRLRLMINERNYGPSYTRNRAMKEAKGEWIAPLDSDDWYAPRRIEKLLRVAQAEDADLVADDVYFIQDGEEYPWGTLLSKSAGYPDGPTHIDAVNFVESNVPGLRRSPLGLTKPLIRRDFLARHDLGYDERQQTAEDFFLYLMCLLRGARFVVVPEPYYFYRRGRPGSINSRDRLGRLNQARDDTLRLLQQELVRNKPEVACALFRRLSVIEHNIGYHRVVQPIKKGAYLSALTEAVRNPRAFTLFLARIPDMLQRRFHRRRRRIEKF